MRDDVKQVYTGLKKGSDLKRIIERQCLLQTLLSYLDFVFEPHVSDERFEQEFVDGMQYEDSNIIDLYKRIIVNSTLKIQMLQLEIE